MPAPAKKPKTRSKQVSSKSKQPLLYRHRRLPIRLAYHRHSGKRLPFYCTSYAALFGLIVFVAALLVVVSRTAGADSWTGSGLFNLTANVPGPTPSIAATIDSPSDGSRFTNAPLEVKGSCSDSTIVDIYRNQVFAGSASCDARGSYSLNLTLSPGKNQLVARIHDLGGQFGPEAVTTVWLDPPTVNNSISPVAQAATYRYQNPLLVYTQPVQPLAIAHQAYKLDYQVDGDKPPYAVAIDWGDGSAPSLANLAKNGDFSAVHSFERAGQLTIRIKVLGGGGGEAVIQTIVFVSPDGSSSDSGALTIICPDQTNGCLPPSNGNFDKTLSYFWVAIIVTGSMVLSFWLGEKVLYSRLNHDYLLRRNY